MKQLRTSRGGSLDDVARALGETAEEIGSWESVLDAPGPQPEQLVRLAEYFGVTQTINALRDDDASGDYQEDSLLRQFFETDLGRRAVAYGLRSALAGVVVPFSPTVELYAKLSYILLDDICRTSEVAADRAEIASDTISITRALN
jgi:transcriptional regulator with XRE-family HTH domain